jgi:DNA polymerase III subunit epsilon
MSLFDHTDLRGPRIVIFDCETTGIDFGRDQIIELCVQRGLEESAGRVCTWRIRPDVEIQPAAQAIHGISAAELAGCPRFSEIAADIARVFAESEIIVGYNVAFDLEMLRAEYTRLPDEHPAKHALELTGKQVVDALRLWQKCEPRSLQHAHQRFVGNAFASAHSASADVAATGRVLAGMLKHFKLDEPQVDWDRIADVSAPPPGVDRAK